MIVPMIGSATSPEIAAPRSGIARTSPSAAYMTMSATATSENTIAFGTSRRGSETSSAMSPALSKPMKLQPMSATAASMAPNDAPEPSTAGPSKIADSGCSR